MNRQTDKTLSYRKLRMRGATVALGMCRLSRSRITKTWIDYLLNSVSTCQLKR